eukprot:UN19995
MRSFIVMLFLLILGFTIFFMCMAPYDSNDLKSTHFGNIFTGFYYTFVMALYGEIEDGLFDGVVLPELCYFLFFVMGIIVTVVMLNALISHMGDSYDR